MIILNIINIYLFIYFLVKYIILKSRECQWLIEEVQPFVYLKNKHLRNQNIVICLSLLKSSCILNFLSGRLSTASAVFLTVHFSAFNGFYDLY